MEPGKIAIHLYYDQKEIFVESEIILSQPKNEFAFYVAAELEMDSIYANTSIEIKKQEEQLEFLAPSIRYVISGEHLEFIRIKYHGKVVGVHTICEEDIAAVNVYSSWYPVAVEESFRYEVKVHLQPEFILVHGERIDETCWKYIVEDEIDLNIIAMKNFLSFENDRIQLYYYGAVNTSIVKQYIDSYVQFVTYYEDLYGNKRAEKLTMVCLSHESTDGAYFRKNLIVFGSVYKDMATIKHLIAHETAHAWCTGAKVDSWEDWMNETFAEWSALLALKETQAEDDLFLKYLNEYSERGKDAPRIKTVDGTRPEDTHTRGVYLLRKLYEEKGSEVVKDILRTFDGLESKSTEGLIKALNDAGNQYAADYIHKMIEV